MNLREKIDRVIYNILVVLMAVMVVNVLWQVLSRYLFTAPSSWTEELARYLLIWIGLLGAGYVTGKKLHLAIDLLPSKLTGKKARRLEVTINVLVALFAFFVLIWGGSNLVYITFVLEQPSPALGIPLAFIYTVLPLSGVIIIYYSIDNLFRTPEMIRTQPS